MRIIFFGSPEFAIPALEKLAKSPFRPLLVVSRLDSPSGRGLKIKATPVKEKASQLDIPVLTPPFLKEDDFLKELISLQPDLFVVIGFPILPSELLAIPKIGALNVHPSLLPAYRGPAPIERAIMAGESKTGVSIILLSEMVDQGPILAQEVISIDPEETAGELERRLSLLGARMLLAILPSLMKGEIHPLPQSSLGASWAPKIRPQDCQINWQEKGEKIKNLTLALNPSPGAYTFRQDKGKRQRLKIWRVTINKKDSLSPGEVIVREGLILVGTGDYALSVIELQPEGRKSLSAEEFLRGYRILPGERWG